MKRKRLKLRQCHTVRELIDELGRVRGGMPVELFEDGVVLVTVNSGAYDEHLAIEGTNETSWEPGKDWERRP